MPVRWWKLKSRHLILLGLLPLVLLTVGCRQGMFDQAKYEPYEASTLFADGGSSRPLPQGSIPRGHLRADRGFHTGIGPGGEIVAQFPMEVDRKLIARGRERFNVFCLPCHGPAGAGNGMIVQRGFKRPPSFHIERLRNQPPGYFVNTISQGFGQMSSYASQVPPADRWAIAAYIRALQLSRHFPEDELTEQERAALEALGTGEETTLTMEELP